MAASHLQSDIEVDIIAVGSGMGASCAALAAQAQGLEAIILEKSGVFGGGTHNGAVCDDAIDAGPGIIFTEGIPVANKIRFEHHSTALVDQIAQRVPDCSAFVSEIEAEAQQGVACSLKNEIARFSQFGSAFPRQFGIR